MDARSNTKVSTLCLVRQNAPFILSRGIKSGTAAPPWRYCGTPCKHFVMEGVIKKKKLSLIGQFKSDRLAVTVLLQLRFLLAS